MKTGKVEETQGTSNARARGRAVQPVGIATALLLMLVGLSPAPIVSAVEDPGLLPPGGIDSFDGDVGDVKCTGTYRQVAEGGSTEASTPPPLDGTIPMDPVPEVQFCPWCAIVGIVIGVIMLTVALTNLYRDLSADPKWTYDQEMRCTATGYWIGVGGSGGLAREVSIVYEGEVGGHCKYDGVLETGCTFTIADSNGVLTYTKHWVDDIVYLTGEPCFQPNAIARNTAWVDPLGLLGPVERTFSEFHPDGICQTGIDIEWTEVCGTTGPTTQLVYSPLC